MSTREKKPESTPSADGCELCASAGYAFVCPGCGGETDSLAEGYCEPCSNANQAYLDEHNAAYDRWQTMEVWKRELEIKDAIHRA